MDVTDIDQPDDLVEDRCKFCGERFERPREAVAGAVLTRHVGGGPELRILQYQLVQKDGVVFHKCDNFDAGLARKRQ